MLDCYSTHFLSHLPVGVSTWNGTLSPLWKDPFQYSESEITLHVGVLLTPAYSIWSSLPSVFIFPAAPDAQPILFGRKTKSNSTSGLLCLLFSPRNSLYPEFSKANYSAAYLILTEDQPKSTCLCSVEFSLSCEARP